MLGYTKIQIMGNLGGTPEMKFLPSGDPVVNFSVAVNRRYKDREGNQKEATDWFRVCAFNGVGEACAKLHQRGDEFSSRGAFRCGNTIPSRTERKSRSRLSPARCAFLDQAGPREASVQEPKFHPAPANLSTAWTARPRRLRSDAEELGGRQDRRLPV